MKYEQATDQDVPDAAELRLAVERALFAGYDHFEAVDWSSRQTVVWPMRLMPRHQGNWWDGLSFGEDFRMHGYSHRTDH